MIMASSSSVTPHVTRPLYSLHSATRSPTRLTLSPLSTMASSSFTLSSPPPLFPKFHTARPHLNVIFRFHSFSNLPRLRSSRRILYFSQESDHLVDDPRNWTRNRSVVAGEYGDDEDDDDEDDDEEDRSLDLLVKFVQNVFKKLSKRTRKAVRSVLPVPISSKLVGFSVDGVLMLTFLWVLKAFLEVICTLGSVVFVSILLIRGIWTGVSYVRENRNHTGNELSDDHRAWTGTQPAT